MTPRIPAAPLLATLLSLLFAALSAPCAFAAPMNVSGAIPAAPGQAALQTILSDLAKQRTEVVTIQRELVSRPAIGPEAGGEGEEAKAAWLLTLLKERGIGEVERVDSVDRTKSLDPESGKRDVRPNIIVRHAGADGLEKGRTLWIICHLHVAAPGPLELWNGSPWTLRVEGDTLYGRGVMDNYQSVTAALLLFESLSKNGIRPPMNLGLVLHSQNSGFRHVLEAKPDLFKPGDLFLVPDHGNPQGTVMGTAEKGLLWLKLTVTGQQGHAATAPYVASALVAGSRLIASLPELDKAFPARDPLFAIPASTFVATKAFTGDDGVNAIAAEYTLYLDCRFVPPYAPDDVEAGVRRFAEAVAREASVSIAVERLVAWPAMPPTPADSPVARALTRAVAAQMPRGTAIRPEGLGTTTAASFLRAKGLFAVSWAKIDPARRQSANESTLIGDHLDEAGVFARMLFDPEAARAPAAFSRPAASDNAREGP